jgi:hypothetical protein
MLATMRVMALEDVRVFTNKATPVRPLCANYRNDEDGPFPQKQETQWLLPLPLHRLDRNQGLELLGEARVNEPASGIVGEAGITDRVSTFPVCLRRILTENVIAPNSDDRASQQMIQGATSVVAGLSRGSF